MINTLKDDVAEFKRLCEESRLENSMTCESCIFEAGVREQYCSNPSLTYEESNMITGCFTEYRGHGVWVRDLYSHKVTGCKYYKEKCNGR